MLPRRDQRSNRVTIGIVRKLFFFAAASAAFVGFVACVGDDPTPATPASDASTDSTGTVDATPTADAADAAPPRCNVEAPFTTVARVAELSTNGGDYGLSFTADGLSAYVATGVAQVIFVHTRSSTNVPFGGAIPLSGMPSDVALNYAPTISADGKELFFAHGRKDNGATDIYRAEISGGGAQNVGPAPGVNGADAGVIDDTPFLANDRALYLARRSEVGAGARLHRAERATPSVPFSNVVPVNGLGTVRSETHPVVTADELHVYFAAVEEDAGLNGFTRIMRASRVNEQMPFGTPVAVEGLDVADGRDAPLWLSPDRCSLYFFSDREKIGQNDPDVWVAKRNP